MSATTVAGGRAARRRASADGPGHAHQALVIPYSSPCPPVPADIARQATLGPHYAHRSRPHCFPKRPCGGRTPTDVKPANDRRAAARKRGVHIGRKPKLTDLQRRVARERVAKGESARSIAREWGVAHTTLAGLGERLFRSSASASGWP